MATPRTTPRTARVAIIVLVVLAVVVAAGLIGSHMVADALKKRVVAALGPLGSAESIDANLSVIRLHNVRLRGPQGWPAADTLRAETIDISPDLRELLSNRVRIRNVTVENFTLSVLRSADGRMQLLPNLKQTVGSAQQGENGSKPKNGTSVDTIQFKQGTIEFFDASVRKPPYKINLTQANATVGPLNFPALADHTAINLSAAIKGPAHTGNISLNGWIALGSKDSDTTTSLRSVDVVTLQPYLMKGTATPVSSGTLDLDLHATVNDYTLRAPGTLTLKHLEIASGDGLLGTFMSIPKQAAVAALKSHKDQIKLHFELDGNLRDPHFSLDENLATRLGAGFAKALGVSVQGVAEGAGATVKGLGDAVKSLIGQ